MMGRMARLAINFFGWQRLIQNDYERLRSNFFGARQEALVEKLIVVSQQQNWHVNRSSLLA
jgi:hypothetical protein